MSKLATITRRSFMIGTAALSGGIAFGTYKASAPIENPLKALQSEGAVFNPWVMITPDEIRLIVPHVDMGQGVQSLQARLLAEELDVELDQVSLSFGAPSAAYYNTAMADEGAPVHPEDHSFTAEMTRAFVGVVVKVLGMQITGGSTASADSFDKLRAAGAAARETLKAAAAARTGLDRADLTTKGAAVHLPDGSSIPYTELAREAALVSAPKDIELRDAGSWRMIGASVGRTDMVAKCTGTLSYSIDFRAPDMAFATVRRNPAPKGTLQSFDANAARSMRGVEQILEIPGGIAVIASNTWYAITAANAVDCVWSKPDFPLDQEGHWQEVEASFVADRLNREWINEGKTETLGASHKAITTQYRAPYVAHQPLEPLSATIKVTPERVDIWTGHQIPRFVVSRVAEITGHEAEQVHLHNQFIGGSFGHRLEFDFVDAAAQVGMQLPGRTVQVTWSREEDFAHDYPRQITAARARGLASQQGVESLDIEIASVSSSQSQMSRLGLGAGGPDPQIVAGVWNAPYALSNFRVRGYLTPELAPVSSWRSVGASTAGFFFESFLDEVIHSMGLDPMEERLRLANTPSARAVLRSVAEQSNWGSALKENQGRGVALVQSFGVNCAQVVEVSQTEDGLKIDKVFVAADVGRVLDPVNFDNLVKGGVIFGLGHAMNCEITYAEGTREQVNFFDHEGMRMRQCPEIYVRGVERSDRVKGIGEPPVPPAAPALANAIFDATGIRLRSMPFYHEVDFA